MKHVILAVLGLLCCGIFATCARARTQAPCRSITANDVENGVISAGMTAAAAGQNSILRKMSSISSSSRFCSGQSPRQPQESAGIELILKLFPGSLSWSVALSWR